MFAIIGIVVVFGAVIAGYLMEHGNLKVLIQPAELVIIGGAAIGTVLIGNPLHILKQMAAGVAGVFGGSKFSKQVYLESLKTVYASSQVDKKKVGHLALAIQVAFQELGVFPASNTQVPVDAKDPMPFSTVQAVETAQRVPPSAKSLAGPAARFRAQKKTATFHPCAESCRKRWRGRFHVKKSRCAPFPMAWSSACARLVSSRAARRRSNPARSRPSTGSHRCWRSAIIGFASRVTPTTFPSTTHVLVPTGSYLPLAPYNSSACS